MSASSRSPLAWSLLLLGCTALALAGHRPSAAEAFSSSVSARCSSRCFSSRARCGRVSTAGRLRASSSSGESAGVDDKASATTPPQQAAANHRIASAAYSHHAAVKTRNIENAIKFYSLLGFRVESKFVAGPARCAWLLHESCSRDNSDNSNGNSNGPKSRIELLEVPSYMLDEPEGTTRRAIDLAKREELLGLNHFALDVTNNIPRPDNDDGASADGSACALYQLQEWMDDLNALSIERFGKSLRVALSPVKRIIGKEVYEMAFLYDADGALVELLNHSGTLEQEMDDGWAPWDGQGDAEPNPNSDPDHRQHAHHPCHPRLLALRNVGIFAHVDAGKTTVTERMLALSGLVHDAGSVDDGDTVTDYLPAERERGITIQSAAVGFEWVVPPAPSSDATTKQSNAPKRVAINLIDTPGHVDFSVEVHRSVAVLDGAVLVVDAVAGVQAQTETVWRAIRNADRGKASSSSGLHGTHAHEPLPAVMFVNKMDREGADFRHAMNTVRRKLNGSNPVAVQLPLYRVANHGSTTKNGDGGSTALGPEIAAGSLDEPPPHGGFVGVVDLVHLRALIYPDDAEDLSIEDAAPTVVSLTSPGVREGNPALIEAALDARRDLISNLADVDETMEDLYLNAMEGEEEHACPILASVSTEDIRSSLRRTSLNRTVMPTLCGAALRGVGVEPVLDCVAEYLPCPLDRLPPQLQLLGNNSEQQRDAEIDNSISLGHPLHSSTLAYVFKVLHMKGRGGSGDGRVAFARVYSGKLKARDSVRVVSPAARGANVDGERDKKQKHPMERIGGMLELSGGRFDNLPDGSCPSGDVCALVGLKSVVTGDTLLLTSAGGSYEGKQDKKKTAKNRKNDLHWKQYMDGVHLAGLASPRPVLTLRVEASSSSEQSRLSDALTLLTVEDPSLVVEETPTTTLISGLGELHMEIVLDRLRREFGLEVRTGRPAVAYRETVLLENGEEVETDGMVVYDRTVGGVQLQGGVRLLLRTRGSSDGCPVHELCVPPEDPIVTLSPEARAYFDLDPNAPPDESELKYPPPLKALLSGARGSLRRGRLGPHPLANVECQIVEVDSELSNPDQLPGALRAAAANAVAVLLESLAEEGRMSVLEPRMSVEVSVPTGRVGDVLSDLTGRRGTVDDVLATDEGGSDNAKSVVEADVPLVEILGYANSLRSLTGGEGAFSAEYRGHLPRDGL
ncbi:hypothetical protein ACHAXT_012171 [Thalassiosira profunda]